MIRYSALALILLFSSTFTALTAVANEPDGKLVVEIGSTNQKTASLEFGSTKASVLHVRYDDQLDPDSLRVFLGEKDVSALFHPQAELEEQVMLPLSGGENVLILRGVLWYVDEGSGRYVSNPFEQKLIIHRDLQSSVQASFKTAKRPTPETTSGMQ